MRNEMIYGGKNLKDFGVYISGPGVFNAPKRNITTISIPGRNGDLTCDNGKYENTDGKYPAFIVEDMATNIEALRNYLLCKIGYQRIEDTYNPDEYRMGRFKGPFTAKPDDSLKRAKFDLIFDCMPQRYLKSGEEYISVSDGYTLLNPTLMTALPLIRVSTLDSAGWIQIGSLKVSIGRVGITVIDCEMQEAYDGWDGTINCNSYITLNNGSFPCLTPGENSIALANCTASIMPRWWRL